MYTIGIEVHARQFHYLIYLHQPYGPRNCAARVQGLTDVIVKKSVHIVLAGVCVLDRVTPYSES